MRFVKSVGVALLFLSAGILGACSDLTAVTMTNDRTQADTAAVLGVPTDDVKISDLDEDVSHVYYKALTRSGKKYDCILHMLSPPTCKQERW